MKRPLLLCFAWLLLLPLCLRGGERVEWKTDLDYLFSTLSEKHCNPFAVRSGEEFRRGLDAIAAQSDALSDLQVALRTQQLIASLGDSHTRLDFTRLLDAERVLPLHLLWTSDGLHVIHTTPENGSILGRRLVSIGGACVETVVDSLATLLTRDNEAMVKMQIPYMIPYLQLLEFFGFADAQGAELELEDDRGARSTYRLLPATMSRERRVSLRPDSVCFSLRHERELFTDAYFPDEKIYYLLYNRCWSRESELKYGSEERAARLPSLTEFWDRAMQTLADRPVEKIVFDMRYNGGGNSVPGTEFVQRLAAYLELHPEVEMYVVTGRATFSSAILNAMDFRELTDALFVGEPTAGKPNHYGEVRSFTLPGSKLSVAYSTRFFRRTQQELPTLMPDVRIEMSFSDFRRGIDPVFEWIRAR